VSGLAIVAQDDFAAGILRGVAPDVQPGVGLYSSVNGFYDDDGDIYKRGGTSYYSIPPVAQINNLTFIWSGFLARRPTVVLGDTNSMYYLDGAKKPVNMGGGPVPGPCQGAVTADTLFMPNGVAYGGGGLLQNYYNAGTATFDPADDYHELPGGVQVMGLASIRDTLLGFSNFGLWSVANMSYDLTDAQGNIQQTLSLLTPEVSLWQEGGLCEWNGKIIAPCIDKIFVVDALSAPVPISTSIAPDYQSFVRGGFQLGGARVFNNHLFMPVLDSALGASALYVCRLDRPVQGRQLYFPWSTFTNSARSVTHFDVALIAPKPMLLGAQTNHVFSDYAPVFTPNANNRLDSGSQAYEFDVETRDFPTGNGQPNHVRKLRLRYTLEGDAAILAGYSYGSVAQTYDALRSGSTDYADVKVDYANYEIVFRGPTFIPGGLPASPDDPARFWYTLYDQTPPDPGVDPVTWQLPQAQRVRYIRFRFRTTDAPARLVVHHLDFHVRSAGHDR
jgi:hypothetical protein